MSLACRFCHPDPVRSLWEASYATIVLYPSKEAVACEVHRIESLQGVFPGHCVQCEVCHRYSMISYALACHLHGDDIDINASAHYATLCASFARLTEYPEEEIDDATDDDTTLCNELLEACDCEDEGEGE
jgi:hypothetical protein